jgi:N-acyl-D-amino-acid deacylase
MAQSLLIKNGNVLDGSGSPAVRADVLIKGAKVIGVGRFLEKPGMEIVDAEGAYVAPGFIDSHNDADRYLSILRDPGQGHVARQGFTTIICGVSGVSLAPLLYGSTDIFRDVADTTGININWRTLGEMWNAIQDLRPGVNFATFCGYDTVREGVAGGKLRQLTENERKVALMLIRRSLEEGAMGVALNDPGTLSKEELVQSALTAVFAKRLLSFQLPDTATAATNSLNSILRIAAANGTPLFAGRVLPRRDDAAAWLKIVEKLEREGVPFAVRVSDFASVHLLSLLPDSLLADGPAAALSKLWDEWHFKRIAQELPELSLEESYISSIPGQDYLTGLSLKTYAESRGVANPQVALATLMRETQMRGAVISRSLDKETNNFAWRSRHALISSAGSDYLFYRAGRAVGPDTSSVCKFLEFSSRERRVPEAVRQLTSYPAQVFGLEKQGLGTLLTGSSANVTVFWGGDIRLVVVNGQIEYQAGKDTGVRAGKTILA